MDYFFLSMKDKKTEIHVSPFGSPMDMGVMKNILNHELEYTFRNAVPTGENLAPPIRPHPLEYASIFFTECPAYDRVTELVRHIHKLAPCHDPVIVCALILLDRVTDKDPRLKITPYTGRRLLITAIFIMSKMLHEHDHGHLAIFSAIGHFYTPGLLQRLEVAMLKILDYKVFVSYEEYHLRLRAMMERQEFKFVTYEGPEMCVYVIERPPPIEEDGEVGEMKDKMQEVMGAERDGEMKEKMDEGIEEEMDEEMVEPDYPVTPTISRVSSGSD